MADFGAAAELSLELKPGAAAAVRDEIESELSGIGVGVSGGGVAGTLTGGGGGSGVTDGGVDAISGHLSEQTDILEDILDELETGTASGGGSGFLPPFLGGDGGGSSFLGGLAGASLIEALKRAGGVASKGAERSVGTAVLNIGTGGLLAPGQEREFTGPFSQLQAAAEGLSVISGALSGGTNVSTEETNRVIAQSGLEIEEPAWVEELDRILDNSVSEPGWFEQMEQILNDGNGDGGGTQPTATSPTDNVDINPGANGSLQAGTDPRQASDPNRAEQQRINRRGANTPNVNVNINADGFGSRTAEDVMEEAKNEAVREIERKLTRSRREGL